MMTRIGLVGAPRKCGEVDWDGWWAGYEGGRKGRKERKEREGRKAGKGRKKIGDKVAVAGGVVPATLVALSCLIQLGQAMFNGKLD